MCVEGEEVDGEESGGEGRGDAGNQFDSFQGFDRGYYTRHRTDYAGYGAWLAAQIFALVQVG